MDPCGIRRVRLTLRLGAAPFSLAAFCTRISPLLCPADSLSHLCADLTSVIVGVFGPIEASPKEELIDRATIQVNFQPAIAQSGGADKRLVAPDMLRAADFTCSSILTISLLFRIFATNPPQRLWTFNASCTWRARSRPSSSPRSRRAAPCRSRCRSCRRTARCSPPR